MKSIDSEQFFKLISTHSGVPDLQTVRDIYYGMVRTMSRELRDRQVIRLPDWGEFNLKIHKGRKMININTGQMTQISAKPTVKFSPDYKVKKYYYALGQESTMI
jgi:nucleoid DNA-binding protein